MMFWFKYPCKTAKTIYFVFLSIFGGLSGSHVLFIIHESQFVVQFDNAMPDGH